MPLTVNTHARRPKAAFLCSCIKSLTPQFASRFARVSLCLICHLECAFLFYCPLVLPFDSLFCLLAFVPVSAWPSGRLHLCFRSQSCACKAWPYLVSWGGECMHCTDLMFVFFPLPFLKHASLAAFVPCTHFISSCCSSALHCLNRNLTFVPKYVLCFTKQNILSTPYALIGYSHSIQY